MHPLRAQREYTGIRRQERKPPHASRDRHQPARHQRTPTASDVFLARSPATHLARVTFHLIFVIPRALKARRGTCCWLALSTITLRRTFYGGIPSPQIFGVK